MTTKQFVSTGPGKFVNSAAIVTVKVDEDVATITLTNGGKEEIKKEDLEGFVADLGIELKKPKPEGEEEVEPEHAKHRATHHASK